MKGRKREEKIPADPPTCLLPELSAEEVHKNILRCFRLRNRVDLKLLGWIKVLLEGNHARALGSRTPVKSHQATPSLRADRGLPGPEGGRLPSQAPSHGLRLREGSDLHWKSRADRIELVLKEEVEELASVPPAVIVVEKKEVVPDRGVPKASETERQIESVPQALPAQVRRSRESEGVTETLKKIGYNKEEARERVCKALELLSGLGRAPTGDEIFNTALRGKAVVFGASFLTSGKSGPAGGHEGELPRRAPQSPESS